MCDTEQNHKSEYKYRFIRKRFIRMGLCLSDLENDDPLISQVGKSNDLPYFKDMVVPETLETWGMFLQRSRFLWRSRHFTVTNTRGEKVLNVRGENGGFLNPLTQISGLDNRPIMTITSDWFSWRKIHYLVDPYTQRTVATARLSTAKSWQTTIKLFRKKHYENSSELLLEMRGSFSTFTWLILNNRGENIARVNGGATSRTKHYVEIAPGVDAMFVLALVLVAEELSESRQ
mmetsp:Transcript_18488/g.40016  ORF Transcript_18488/g.40016 Transcript_18488/m.40016 type:complete len:232 (+) Transcript_18488:71-766(+)